MRFTSSLLALAFFVEEAVALSAAGWRDQAIYQVVTDRFARTDGSVTAKCDALYGLYCGGTWEGIVNHLDYVQNMGFTAVCTFSHTKYPPEMLCTDIVLRSGSRLSWNR